MPSVANRLIEGLPRNARSRLLALCEPIELRLEQILSDRDALTRHIYFPTSSTLSLWTSPGDLPVLEVAMVGSEGMIGAHVALGVPNSATFARVRRAGSAWRLPAALFKSELNSNEALLRSTHRYLHVMMLQGASMVRCSRFHNLNQRLARWLLMTQDRAHQDRFVVTHAMLASTLGVRRVGVTTAAIALQRSAVIEYKRGQVTILDRGLLESAACICYENDRRSYSQFLSQD